MSGEKLMVNEEELAHRLLRVLNRIACALEQIADNTAPEESLAEALMQLRKGEKDGVEQEPKPV